MIAFVLAVMAFFQRGRIHRVSALVHIDEHRRRPTIGNRFRGRDECIGHRDHLVSRPDA